MTIPLSHLSFHETKEIVTHFYSKATTDILIGFHFKHIPDFSHHIERISYFWELQLTGKISQPEELPFKVIDKHKPLHIKPGQLDRWIVLFYDTLDFFEGNLPEEKKHAIQLWREKIEHFRQRFHQHPTLLKN